VRFLVFQHLDVEHPGIFREFWRDAGIELTTVELDAGGAIPTDLTVFDAMIVMGGPMDVWQTGLYPWLVPEIAAIRRFAVLLGRPYLGVCLGHQLLARALAQPVALASLSEVGPCQVELTGAAREDALFGGLTSPLTTFQWHSAEVKQTPADAVILARTDRCEIQAFRWGPHAYGLQFHAEITEATVGEWADVPAYARSLDEVLGEGAAARLAVQTQNLLPGFRRTAAHLSDRFLQLVRSSRADITSQPAVRSAP
jgi:GMP synthase-like glutamine amidotransferase